REGDEVHVDRQQHQLDRHEDDDQVAAVEEDPDDADREQDGAERQVVRQAERQVAAHDSPPAGFAAAAGPCGPGWSGPAARAAARALTAGSLTSRTRSLARTFTCRPGVCPFASLRRRSVRAIAATIATSRMAPATCSG